MNTLPTRLRAILTGVVALLLIAGAASTAYAQTTLQAQLALRPLTTDDVTIYKLPATAQLSSGLSTVGLGQPAYLQALVNSAIPAGEIAGVTWTLRYKPGNSKAVLADSPLKNVPPYEPADRLISQVAGQTMLRPDFPGLYIVKATISTVSAGTATIEKSIIAGTYVGIKTCTVCHSGGLAQTKAPSWAKTAHASIFRDGVNGVASDHYASSCLGCHTVGYDTDPAAMNGGFDDIAAELKWTFPTVLKPGTFEALPDALKNVGNIQCENCHGPGSQHAASGGDTIQISVSLDSGVCGRCHNAGTHHVKSAEWNNSVHAVTTREPSGAGREGCVGCHTGAGFIGRMKAAKTVDTAYSAITCQACHEPHGQTTPETSAHLVRASGPVKLQDGTVVETAGLGALCMNCHQSRRNAESYVATTAGSSHYGPHGSPQADMIAGTNAITYGQSIPSSAHGEGVEDTCVGCHMQAVDATSKTLFNAGGHTFKMAWDDGKNPRVELVGACQECHGKHLTTFNFRLLDYDGDGVIDGVQTEVQHLLDKLALMLPPEGQPKSTLAIDATWSKTQLQAAYNWTFVVNDGSKGIHNTAFTVGLLKTTIANLAASKK